MPLELKIQIGIREAAGAPVFLGNDFARQWRKFVTKGTAPRTGCKEMSLVTPRLNRCDVLPRVAFILKSLVPVMRGEEHRYARGASCLESCKHVRYAVNGFRNFLNERPEN